MYHMCLKEEKISKSVFKVTTYSFSSEFYLKIIKIFESTNRIPKKREK